MPINTKDLPPRPTLSHESALWSAGFKYLAGLDEAGRGALAGPVAVGALVLPPDESVSSALYGVRDSKQMLPAQREYWAWEIKRVAISWGVGFADPDEIDQMGISRAVILAAGRALTQLSVVVDFLLIDYFTLPDNILPQRALVKGDRISLSIAGASVLAKTARDTLMVQLDQNCPGYGFALHKGYGTLTHRTAIARLGNSPYHRTSYQVSLPA
jgi:ribonuclease HII